MSQLRPTLWRTCRVIASETRLRLLWLLFEQEARCVADLAEEVGISCHNASTQLRALSARGLIAPHRTKLKVFYSPEVNEAVAHASVLLNALRRCAKEGMPLEAVIQQATAFTHVRRIVLVRALNKHPLSFGDLQEKTGISSPALSKHVSKLESRGFLALVRGGYHLSPPKSRFGRVLLEVACS